MERTRSGTETCWREYCRPGRRGHGGRRDAYDRGEPDHRPAGAGGALPTPRRLGLALLIREAGLEDKAITATSIGYTLAPRINASGRMGRARTGGGAAAHQGPGPGGGSWPRSCAHLNRERQTIEGEIFRQCVDRLDRGPPEAGAVPLVLVRGALAPGRGGHRGLPPDARSTPAPAFMICLDDGDGQGLLPLLRRRSTCLPRWRAALTCWRASAATSWPPASPSGRRTSRFSPAAADERLGRGALAAGASPVSALEVDAARCEARRADTVGGGGRSGPAGALRYWQPPARPRAAGGH